MNRRSNRAPVLLAAVLSTGLILCSADKSAQGTDDFASHHERGVELLNEKDFPGAIVEFRAAIRLKPDAAIAHKNLGIALLRIGEITDAIAEMQTAIRLKPEDANAHNNLGSALLGQGIPSGGVPENGEEMRVQRGPAAAPPNCDLAPKKRGKQGSSDSPQGRA